MYSSKYQENSDYMMATDSRVASDCDEESSHASFTLGVDRQNSEVSMTPGETSDKKGKGTRKKRGGASTDSKQRRLEKNRISARESRKRKKNYIESVEQRMEHLERENSRLHHLIENMREKQKISYLSNMSSIDEFITGRQELYDKLEQYLAYNG